MKKVQVFVGSLGVAAPILAMMTPGPAQAEIRPADQPANGNGKTVSVPGASRASAQAAATSSSTSMITPSPSVGSAGSPNTVRCEGAKEYQKTKNDESLKFWSNPLGNPVSYNCIGTVEGKWFDWSSKQHWVYRVKVYSDGNWTNPVYNKKTAGTKVNSHTIYGQQGIHKWYRAPVRVCTTWYSSVSPGSIAVICKTID
jgi:hypothetical protein